MANKPVANLFRVPELKEKILEAVGSAAPSPEASAE